MKKIILASSNEGKINEIKRVLAGINLQLLPQSKFNISDANETGLSFIENALIKARHASAMSNLPALADDSGLEVDILEGRPGIYSSRYAGKYASDSDNIKKLLTELAHVPRAQRRARFWCVLVYLRHSHDPTPLIAQGCWDGFITEQPSGHNGFGYDPVFYVPELQCTCAELDAQTKNQLSHRAQALQQLVGILGAA